MLPWEQRWVKGRGLARRGDRARAHSSFSGPADRRGRDPFPYTGAIYPPRNVCRSSTTGGASQSRPGLLFFAHIILRMFGSEHWETCKNLIKTMVSATSYLPQLYCTNNSREHTNVFPSTVQLNIRKVMVAGHTILYGARSWG